MSFFPLHAGWPAGLYLGLYVVTLAVHAAFIGYVVAGAAYAALAALRPRAAPDPIAAVLRDWLPFALGVGITAGVAPLLFVQILYQERFYTANLLLFHRWMAIVPVLIVSFYLLYLHKSERVTRPALRAGVIGIAALGFVFVAWSWTENHLLSLDDSVWRDFYAAGRLSYGNAQLAPRLAMWLLAALPSLAIGAAWQVRGVVDGMVRDAAVRRLGFLALAGIAGSTACAAWLWTELPAASRAGVEAPIMLAWLFALVAARGAEVVAWLLLLRRPYRRPALVLATVASSTALVAGAAIREAVRLGHLEALRPRVVSAGALPVFLLAMVAMVAALIWIGLRVRAGLATAARA